MTNPRYDTLFEPVKIGPKTAKNRFFQVPHCLGMGHTAPEAVAAIRKVKAEGGWGVVCTEETEIHPTSDIAPALEGRLWDDSDITSQAKMVEGVHAHGALAGIELCHNGLHAPNMLSREVPLAPSNTLVDWGLPINARAMDLGDIANVRRWFVNAAKRARTAGFDIVYVYAGHDMSLLQHFLSPRHNRRSDAYGGSLENRARLLREVLADTKEAVGDTCAIALRLSVDELKGADGLEAHNEGRDLIEMMAEEPDLWDVNISGWENDSQTARFSEEGFQEPFVSFVKSVTSKPVVAVGRYTSPDTMVRVIKNGIADFIGAARPSIADPFLPNKIAEGREDDIRECIGCNICVASDNTSTPIRCTQNPTMGEEWRKGWHPENIPPVPVPKRVLIVGGGPAGLEAARALGARGCEVTLAEARETFGGRATREAALPGLSTFARIRDWRLGQINQMPSVKLYSQSEMTSGDIAGFDADHIVLATGATWTRAGFETAAVKVMTPDDLMAGEVPKSGQHVVITDEEGDYMGGVLAELCARNSCKVTYITSHPLVSAFTVNTLEQRRIHRRLHELGVSLQCNHTLAGEEDGRLFARCVYTGDRAQISADVVVPVILRQPHARHWQKLSAEIGSRIARIGDCLSPTSLAGAIYSGHRFAREFAIRVDIDQPAFKRSRS